MVSKNSFTLYPAHSRIGRGTIVLRHSVPHSPPNSGGISCKVAGLDTAQTERRKANINMN